MNLFSNLIMGFKVALTPINFIYCLAGVIIGQIIGILPGLGPIVTIAVLLPFTYNLDPLGAIMAFAGIYYGSQFGGAISSILVNAPGTEAAIITAIDGYPMARKGQAGLALATAAWSSFTGGIIGSLLLTVLSPILVKMVITFAAPEYLALMVFALVAITGLSEGTTLAKTCFGICFGLAVSTIGIDVATATARFTFGIANLYEGISFVILAIGMFAFAEVTRNIKKGKSEEPADDKLMAIEGPVKLSLKDFRYIFPTIIRSSISGFFIGVLPGVGSTTSTPLAYITEKKLHPKGLWGKGEMRGVAAGESSNNSCAMGAMVPLLTMAVPGSGTAAIMLTAFMILGVQPGPLLFANNPKMVWGLIASFFVGTVLLLFINLPLVKYCVKVVEIPNNLLFMGVCLLAVVGAYSTSMRLFDVWLMLLFGIVGLIFSYIKVPLTPALVALILGNLIETNLARTIVICEGSIMKFLTRPVVAFFILASVLTLVVPMINKARKKGKTAIV